jgi:hypothetical protein
MICDLVNDINGFDVPISTQHPAMQAEYWRTPAKAQAFFQGIPGVDRARPPGYSPAHKAGREVDSEVQLRIRR